MIGALLWLLFFHRCFHLSSAYSEKTYEFSVVEESPKNTFVGRVTLSPDEKYRISVSNPFIKDLFFINFTNGDIKTFKRIDRDTLNLYDNTIDLIIVSQSAALISIHIKILDINDNPPAFAQQFYNISIVEGAIVGSKFPLQIAKDSDYGINGTIAGYRLKSDDPETLNLFKVNRISDIVGGDALFIELISALDRETKSSYMVEIEALDGGNPSLAGSCILFISVLDVNDNVPTFEHSFLNVTVEANGKENEYIATMKAGDADIGLNADLSYALTDNVGNQFEIDKITGIVNRKTKNLKCNKESCALCLPNICVISIEASDKGVPKLVGRAFLNVLVDHQKPSALQINIKIYPSNNNDYLLIDENTKLGSTLAVLTVTSDNQHNQINVSLLHGNDDEIFELELGRGFAILRLNKKVDFKKQKEYLLTFKAVDKNDAAKISQKTLQVYVRNANEKAPVFKEKRYNANIFESSWINSPVLRIQADSERNNVEYSIVNGTTLPFIINSKTGILKLRQNIDYNNKNSYNFEVKATNPSPSWKTTTVPVKISIMDSNNFAPKFFEAISKVIIPENLDITHHFFQAKCLDMDHGESALIRYRLPDSPEASIIRINEENGKVYLKNEIDFEKAAKFAFDVICENVNSPLLADTHKVLVYVEDINDNYPFFPQINYHVNIYNGDSAGSEIITVSAYDIDEIDKNNLTYFLINAPIGYIDVEKMTGKIFTLKQIDTNTIGSSFNVTIGAKDSEKHLSTNNAVITVHVIDNFNENVLFDSALWIVSIEENAALNYLIGKYTAFSLNNETIEYFLLQGNDYLEINQQTAELRIKRIMDYERIKEIPFTVLAKAGKTVANKNGTIFILDVNDNSPKFVNKKHFNVALSNIAIGYPFGKLSAKDDDSGVNREVEYASKNELLMIDASTGMMWLNSMIVKEAENQLQIQVDAFDKGTPKLSSSMTLVINIKKEFDNFFLPPDQIMLFEEEDFVNLNDKNISNLLFNTNRNISSFAELLANGEIYFTSTQHQLFYKIPYEVENVERQVKFKEELTIYQNPPKRSSFNCLPNIVINIPENADIGDRYYSEIVTNNEVAKFKLLNEYETFSADHATGSIMLLKALDAETKQNYSLEIEVISFDNERTRCTLKINVEDVNDNSPIFDKNFYFSEVSHNVSGQILTIKAHDKDVSSKHNQIIYSLDDDDERRFRVNQTSGEFSISSQLEPNNLYNITVFANNNKNRHEYSQTFVLIKVLPNLTQKPIIFVPQEVLVPELTPLGSVVAAVTALAESQTITFKIVDGNLYSTFEIDPHSGNILLVRPLDYEKIQFFNLTLLAQTKSSFDAIATLIIKVENERDSVPRILTDSLSIMENQKPKSLVGRIEIEDDEKRSISDLEIKILYQYPPNGRFYLNETELFTGDFLDRERIGTFQLMLSIMDKKEGESRGSEKLITVIVEDENDNMPECNDFNAFLISKNAKFPLYVSLNCHDKDNGYNASVGYQMVQNFDNIVMNWRGNLIISGQIDKPLIEVPFIAADRMSNETWNTADALRTSSNSKFVLIKENKGKVFLGSQTTFTIFRTSFPNTVIGSLPLLKSSSRCFIAQEESNQTSHFSLSQNSSQLLLIKSLPSNIKKFHLDVIGFDSVTHKTQIHKVIIEVEENNPNGQFIVPVIAYEIFVNENISIGEPFEKLQVFGTALTNLKFQFHKNEGGTPFQINQKTGEISAKREIDYEKETFYGEEIIISSKAQTITVPVYFHILDINDNSPAFKQSPFNFFVREDSSRGEFVGHIVATDADNHGKNKLRYQLLNAPPSLFTLDTISGILTLSGELDHEKQAFYEFEVRAYDSEGLESKETIFVFVEDVNDNEPKFDDEETKITIAEDVPPGTFVCLLKFDDADIVNAFNFEIDDSTDGFNQFRIDEQGNIYVNNALNREHIDKYHLKIILKDAFYPFIVHEATKFVTIVIDDVNDNPPMFAKNYIFIVNEASAIGAVIGIVAVTDDDFSGSNALIQYRIDPFSNPQGVFVVDPLFGYFILNKKLDREIKSVYHMTLLAMDNGNPALSSSCKITVIVSDDDDNEPVLMSSAEDIHFDENIPIGTLITKIDFEDADEGANAEVIFEIEKGNEDGWFRINPSTGHLFVNRELDYEMQKEFTLNISMTPFSGKHESLYSIINIFLNDLNDEKPTFMDGNYMELKIAENITAKYPLFIYNFASNDKDANSSASFTIQSGNSILFSIDSSTGDFWLNNQLDYEAEKNYDLILKVSDATNEMLFSEINVKILVQDVNDNAPIFIQPYYLIEISENAYNNQTLAIIKANDADSDKNGKIYYSIENKEGVPFSIDYLTGELKATAIFDYEETNSYLVIVRATDSGNLIQHSTDVEVRISIKDENDNSPILKSLKQDVFIKADARKGSIIFVVDAFDADTHDELTLSLNGSDEKYFSIDKRGVIRIKSVLPKQREYSISVVAKDEANATVTLPLMFYLAKDSEFPIFHLTETRFSVPEDMTNYFVTKVSAYSSTADKCLRYLIANEKSNDNFVIDSFTGNLIAKNFDYEKVQEHHLYIAASNCQSPFYTTFQAIILNVKDINDNKPMFEKALYELSIMENKEAPKDFIIQITATDMDKTASGPVSYQIISGNNNNAFEIDANTGKVFQLLELDREEHERYELVIEATDNGNPALKEICMLKINVLDENDNAPRFSRLVKANIPEDTKIGDFITQIITFDADTEEFSKNFYSIEGDDAHYFAIDSMNGNITLAQTLDREKKKSLKFKVFAQDKIWRVSASITIMVEDVNDNTPQFDSSAYNFSVFGDSTKNGYFIGKVKATDLDEGINMKLSYYSYSSHLYIYPETGEIFLTKNLSNLPFDLISAEVFAIDYGAPSNVASTKINIYLIDKYADSPIFQNSEYIFGVENLVNDNVEIGRITVSNGNDRIHYELLQPNKFVTINSVTGQLSGDFATLKNDESIEITVKAVDYKSETPAMTTAIIKGIKKGDFKFKLKKYAFVVYENAAINSTVGYVSANSPYVTYSVLSSNTSCFGIDSQTGRIFISDSIDSDIFPRLRYLELNIEAKFNGYPAKSQTALATIQIIDKNDNSPLFAETQRILYFTNTIPNGAIITVVAAEDIDEPPFNEIYYSISKQDQFDIDSKSGKVIAIADIDFTASNQYSFDIEAANLNATKTSQITIIVQLQTSFQNTAIFAREAEAFEISRRSIISSIAGQLEAHSLFGRNHFLINPNAHFILDKNLGDLILTKRLENSDNFTLTAMVTSGILNRKPPNICRIQIITNELAPPPVFPEKNYIVKLSSNAELLSEVIRFNFILPTDVQMEVEGIGREAFCFDKRGVLMICKKLQLKQYNLILLILSNGRIRSKASMEISVIDEHLSSKINTFASYIPENVNSFLNLMRLPSPFNGHDTMYFITDKFMNEFFALNSTSGILSTTKAFDREKRSLYIVPIKMTSGKKVVNASVNVYIDDEDDNEISNNELKIIISSPKPLFSGIIPWIQPSDIDEVYIPECAAKETENSMIKAYQITSNCSLILNEIPSGKLSFGAIFGSNYTYAIETSVILNNEEIAQNNIIVEMYGSRRSVADFMLKLQASIPDMVVHFLGAHYYTNQTCQLFITILSQSGIVLPPTETIKILDNFVSKKTKSLDILNYRSIISLCDKYPCGSQVCQQIRIMKADSETFRSINTVWTMPQMQGAVKCENEVLLNKKEQLCGENKCYNGVCMDNSTCVCNANYYGIFCESKVYSFGQNSNLKYEPHEPITHLTLHLLTKEPHGLLLFSQSKISNVTFIVDFVNGKLRLMSISNAKHTAVVLQESINDSRWHKIVIAVHQTGIISAIIENCEENFCLPCQKSHCYGTIPAILIDSTIFFGSLSPEKLGSIDGNHLMASASLKACLKIAEINKKSRIKFTEYRMLQTCPLLSSTNYCDSTEAEMSCREGSCINDWDDYKCYCKDGFESSSCNMDDYVITLNNAHIRLELSSFINQELIFSHFKNSKVERISRNILEQEETNKLSTLLPCDSIEDTASESDDHLKDRLDGNAIQWMEIDVRTEKLYANIFSMKYGSQHASLKLVNGTLHYGVYYMNKLIVEIIAEKMISDGMWHRIGIEVSLDGKLIRLIIDGVNKEVESAIAFPRMIFRGLEYIDFGAIGNETFQGCLGRLIINNQIQLLYPKIRSLPKQYFTTSLLSPSNTLLKGCDSTFICDTSLSYGACSGVRMDAKTRITIIAGITVIALSLFVLTIFALLYFYRIRQNRSLNKNAQRISNLQLVSSTTSSYKNYSCDEFIASVLAKNRQSFRAANENLAYSETSIDNLHIYDEAVTSKNTNSEPYTPVHILKKPPVIPRRKSSSNKVKQEKEDASKMNPYKSRFFRPSEEYGLVSSGYALPISLDDFHHQLKEIETGH